MTKRQSILLDILLEDFKIPEYIGNGSLVSIDSVTKGNKLLSELSELEIKELLLLITSEFHKSGIPLIQGNFGYSVHRENISIFLKNGGFKGLYKKKKNSKIGKILLYTTSILTFFILIYSTFFQKDSQNKKAELKTELQEKPTEKIDLTKVSDSLELIFDKNLSGDFNGDNKLDFASIVRNRKNDKFGVIIIHNSKNQEQFLFGAGNEVNQMSDLDWIEIFKTLPKGEIVSPTIVDKETGDIIGQDENQSFKLIGNGIYMSVEESHGGGIIFWNGKEYKWYHIE